MQDVDVSQLTNEELELAQAIVEVLSLDVGASSIDPTAPLYGEGLGLDSIDLLEISLMVSRQYGFQLRSDDSDNVVIFQSLRNLSRYIQTHRTR